VAEESIRKYQAIVWAGDPNDPGERIVLSAASLEEAREQIDKKYGPNIVVSLWNEDDANKPR
jgi:hypothetical protein